MVRRRKIPHDNGHIKKRLHPLRLSGWTCKLLSYEALPGFLKDNEYLLHSHRPALHSFLECSKTIFRFHTETWNIWTHLSGCVCTVLLSLYFLSRPLSEVVTSEKVVFSPFLVGAIFCLACSFLCHSFLCHSESVSNSCKKLDYVGVITLIVSSFSPWTYFGFYCHPSLIMLYLSLVVSLGIVCIIVVVQDKFGKPEYRALRAGLFIVLGLTGVLPFVHYVALYGVEQAVQDFGWLILMALIYIAGGVIYALRIPERLIPGRCDIIGQSHQIMHMCVLAGVLTCYHGATRLSHYRLVESTCPSHLL